MQHSAGAWQISFSLAPPDRIGQYQGFFGSGIPVARTLGPALATTLLVTFGPAGWLLLGAVLLVAATAMTPAVRRAERVCPDPSPIPRYEIPGRKAGR
jgi:MFS family permease